MQQGLIGVIVPVYKVEKYIAECIESILAQTYTKFRLILVDDGTPDNADKICDEYAKKDPRITVIHQENAGVTRARARGVEEASDCEFITFVDSDDTIYTDALLLLTTTMSTQYDIVISKFEGYTYPESSSISVNEYRHLLISESVISCGPTSKLFRRTIFNKHCFDIPRNIIHGEDLLMNVRLAFNTKKDIGILNKTIYNYYINYEGCDMTFRTSPVYEKLFYKHMIFSIPPESLPVYYEDIIKRSVVLMENRIGYKYRPAKEWFTSDYHKKLLEDIDRYSFKYSFLKLTTIKYHNFFIRILPVSILKLLFFKKRLFGIISKRISQQDKESCNLLANKEK